MNKTERVQAARANHAAWLIALGADRDEAQRGTTYRKLRIIEKHMDKVNTDYCNGGVSEDYLETTEGLTKMSVSSLFGGSLPDGFFINNDPRGYALKINDNAMRDYFERWRDQGINAYTDWGGFGILAPDFNN